MVEGVEWGMGGGGGGWLWGGIGKLGGRADSPHYWGWIAFAGRSRVILCPNSISISIEIIISKNSEPLSRQSSWDLKASISGS